MKFAGYVMSFVGVILLGNATDFSALGFVATLACGIGCVLLGFSAGRESME